MKILVTGANGQLGNEMRILAKETNDTYIFTDVTTPEGVETTLLDITDLEAVCQLVKEQGVQCIVNCAAYTNVDKAETDEAFCRTLNAKAPQNLAIAMKEVNGLLVHVSTDYVFGGDPYNIPCREEQKGTPTGVYGQTKLEGEQYIQASGCDYVIIRTATEGSIRSGRYSDLCLRPGNRYRDGTEGLCGRTAHHRLQQDRYLPLQQRRSLLVVRFY